MLSALSLSANARSRKVKKHKATTTTAATSSMIKMHRTGCFGRCADYEVIVYANGLVEYRGKRFSKHQGVYQKNIGAAAAGALLKEFSSKHIDTCEALYEKKIADLPGILYDYVLNGKKGQVYNAESGPMWLRVISTKVDALADVDTSWKKVGTAQDAIEDKK